MPQPTYTAAEVDAAVAALQEPERLRHAQEVVTHAAPGLQRVLAEALHEGGWFGDAHDAEIARAAGEADAAERQRAVAALVADQTRLGMFVGAAVGFQLAHELQRRDQAQAPGEGGAPASPPGAPASLPDSPAGAPESLAGAPEPPLSPPGAPANPTETPDIQ